MGNVFFLSSVVVILMAKGLVASGNETGAPWRTRPDPFEGVWEEEIEPLLRGDPAGKLKATTIVDWLEDGYPGRFGASRLRTVQRRLQDWRALHGPDREVYFPQEHRRDGRLRSTSHTVIPWR